MATTHVPVSPVSDTMAAGVSTRARPMSATRAAPAESMKTLEGLRSRCRMGGLLCSIACTGQQWAWHGGEL